MKISATKQESVVVDVSPMSAAISLDNYLRDQADLGMKWVNSSGELWTGVPGCPHTFKLLGEATDLQKKVYELLRILLSTVKMATEAE